MDNGGSIAKSQFAGSQTILDAFTVDRSGLLDRHSGEPSMRLILTLGLTELPQLGPGRLDAVLTELPLLEPKRHLRRIVWQGGRSR